MLLGLKTCNFQRKQVPHKGKTLIEESKKVIKKIPVSNFSNWISCCYKMLLLLIIFINYVCEKQT